MISANAPVKDSAEIKLNLLNLDRRELATFFDSLGEKSFRADQLFKWIHQLGVSDFQQMNNLSKNLRDKLEECAEIVQLEVMVDEVSSDGTRKWVLQMSDGNRIETVYIPETERGTLCISSQVGCALDCSFCSTGRQGFNRNLTTAEIISQVSLASQLIDEEKKPGKKITNIVFMGMGEPLLNFKNVIRTISILLDDFAYGLSKRRVTVSTAGVIPAIDRLGEISEVRLAVSLHAANDILRDQLVPLNKKYPLKELKEACKRFLDKQSARSRITFEYVMLEGVNDTEEHAHELVKYLKDVPALLNLIPFNPFDGSGYKTTSNNKIKRFGDIVMKAGVTTVIRRTRGDDINAACGQLVGKVADKSRRDRRFSEPRFGMKL